MASKKPTPKPPGKRRAKAEQASRVTTPTGYPPNWGRHVSTAGGLTTGIKEAEGLGIAAIQIFSKNQKQWKAKPLDEPTIAEWTAARDASLVEKVVVHASYLINLAANKPEVFSKSVEAMVDEMQRAAQLGVDAVVVHPGSHGGDGRLAGLKRNVDALDEVRRQIGKTPVKLLLETTAGQGTSLGTTFEELQLLLEAVEDARWLGVCLDTCHLFSAGHNLRDDYDAVMASLDKVVGIKHVGCVHVNDSQTPLASRRDRHEHLGHGSLTKTPFKKLVNDPNFADVPLLLETAFGDHPDGGSWCEANLGYLKSLWKG